MSGECGAAGPSRRRRRGGGRSNGSGQPPAACEPPGALEGAEKRRCRFGGERENPGERCAAGRKGTAAPSRPAVPPGEAPVRAPARPAGAPGGWMPAARRRWGLGRGRPPAPSAQRLPGRQVLPAPRQNWGAGGLRRRQQSGELELLSQTQPGRCAQCAGNVKT